MPMADIVHSIPLDRMMMHARLASGASTRGRQQGTSGRNVPIGRVGIRCELEAEYGISKDWWRRQPGCTSKIGWITMSAAKDAPRRAALQVAACRLGISIVRACKPGEGGETTRL